MPVAAGLDRAEPARAARRAAPAARRPRPGACGRARGSRTAAPRPPRAAPDRRPAPRAARPSASSASAASITARSSAASASASSGMLGRDPVEPPRRLAELGERRPPSPAAGAAIVAELVAEPRARLHRRRAAPARLSSSPGSGASRSSSSTAWASHSRSRVGLLVRRAGRGERAPRPPARRAQAAAAGAGVDPAEASSRARWPRGFSRPRSSCWPWISTSSAPSSRSSPAETGWSLTKARLPPSALTMRRMTSGSPGSRAEAVLVEQSQRRMIAPAARRRR